MVRAPQIQRQIQDKILSAAQGKLALTRIKKLVLPLCSEAEQDQLVHKVGEKLEIVSRVEALFSDFLPMLNSLERQILGKAFRGELVPTEVELARREGRSYQSASELLERMKAGGHSPAPKAQATAGQLDLGL